METFHTIAATTALVVLLLAVLRHRQHPIPGLLRVGAFIAPVGEIFAIAQVVLGPKALNALLVGDYPLNDSGSALSIDNTEVSQTYFVVMQLFHLISVVGMLLIAIGMLMLVRRIIQNHHPIPQQP